MDSALITGLAQTGAIGLIAYCLIVYVIAPLLKSLTADVHGMRTEMGEMNSSLKVLLDRSIRASEQVATEARRSREEVTSTISEKLDVIAKAKMREGNKP